VEKVAQNVGYFFNFQKLPEENNRPIGRKFAQSGYPDTEVP
jgi:hypothetical protein